MAELARLGTTCLLINAHCAQLAAVAHFRSPFAIMARGRAPNLALPPTRALTQQRDYRARKAARISYLEETNAELNKQVEDLKAELAELREGKGRTAEVDKVGVASGGPARLGKI